MTTLANKADPNTTKARLKQRWGKLTDDDLRCAAGKYDELPDRIQNRTGETLGVIEDAIDESYHARG